MTANLLDVIRVRQWEDRPAPPIDATWDGILEWQQQAYELRRIARAARRRMRTG